MLEKSGEHQLIWRNSFRFRGRVSSTLVETNSKCAPENGWLEDFLVSFWDGLFSGALAVSFREGISTA